MTYNTKMQPLRILQLVLEIINNNKNSFKFILNGLKNGIITNSNQKEIVFFSKIILKNYQHHYHKQKAIKI